MQDEPSRYDWLISLGQFGAWILTSAGAILDALYIRSAAKGLLQALSIIQNEGYQKGGGIGIDLQFGYALTATEEVLILILGLVALAAVIWIEYYFRKGRPKGLLLKRIGIVVGVEVAIVAVSALILLFV